MCGEVVNIVMFVYTDSYVGVHIATHSNLIILHTVLRSDIKPTDVCMAKENGYML